MSDPRNETTPVRKVINAFYVDVDGKIRNKVRRGPSSPEDGIAGRVMRDGYRQLKIEGELYQGSRIAWVLHHGEWPTQRIDFINSDRDDHRKTNLRVGTNSEVFSNRGGNSNKDLPKGVSRHACGRFQAQIKHNGKYMYIGLYDSAELAHESYKAAAKNLFGEFYRSE